MLDATRPLARPLRLGRLNVVVRVEEETGDEEGWIMRNGHKVTGELRRRMHVLAETGTLGGFVRRVAVVTRG